MTGLVRKASLLCACGLVVAAAAMAGVPSPGNSSKPTFIDVVGTKAGVPDPGQATLDAGGNPVFSTFTVTVRDFSNNLIVNSQVVVDFSACTDMNLCTVVVGGKTQDCPTRTIRGFTDGSGQIQFQILGAGKNAGNAAGPAGGCANIIADGVSLVHPTVTEYDENGALAPTGGGVGGADLAAWVSDFGHVGTSGYKGRSDFNHDGALGGADLSFWVSRFGTGNSASGCATVGGPASYCSP
jgi:hypothetical protein